MELITNKLNEWGNCKIKLTIDFEIDGRKYKKNSKVLALNIGEEYFLSIGAKFYYLLAKENYIK